MKKLIYIALISLFETAVYAQTFTVLAKSGLNIRREPNSKSEKVGHLPFGTMVDIDFHGRDVDYSRRYKHFSEIIEGKRGFWVKTTFGKTEGYIFSGFGLIGEWVVKSSEINRDYRLLRIGQYCDPINYDPQLNWYALTKNNGKMEVKKSDVILKLTHEFTEKDTLGTGNEYWREFPLVVSSNLSDTVFFLIGTRKPLQEKEIFSEFLGDIWNYTDIAKFLYPEETYSKYYEGKNYTFRAYETVKLTKENSEGYTKQYQIALEVNTHPETNVYNISTDLGFLDTGRKHSQYKTPQLIWVGDMNSDGLLDFIYYSHTMTDSCGVSWEYHLFLSDKDNPSKPIRKVSNQIQGNCIS